GALAFSGAVFAAPAAPAPRDDTGLEWLEASARDRTESLARSMYALQQYGVTLERSPLEYYDDVHEWLRAHPADTGTALTRVLAETVYQKEPAQRGALERSGFKP
ncbi:MAG TPA: hypothetical protein VL404_06925, partial [Candidatus Eisenbacteria bacterium]|nr:hypothetical protein [Candidatus Eisenbacteria bacterium]